MDTTGVRRCLVISVVLKGIKGLRPSPPTSQQSYDLECMLL